MSSSLKRRHDESAYSVAPLSQYHGKAPELSTSEALAISDEDRVNSPHNLLEAHRMFTHPVRESKRTLSFAKPQDNSQDHGEDAEKRVTIWNWREQRKLSGNSAPFKKNLQEYIRKHPDWEEYVGQDKDTMTGKKLSSKKMLPPAPRDANHPYYHMAKPNHGVMPSSPVGTSLTPAPQTSYGTRSSHSRTRDLCSPRDASQHLTPQARVTAADQDIPISIVLESPAAVALRRSVEMAARRKAMQAEVESALTEGEKNAERARQEARIAEEAARDAAWKAATAAVAQQQEEKLAAKRQMEEASLQSRQSSHAEEQDQVVGLAMSRIQAFKKRRIEGA